MVSASVGLTVEGARGSMAGCALGFALGFVMVAVVQRLLHKDPAEEIAQARSPGAARGIVVVLVMTVHSLAEGVGIGVAFGRHALDTKVLTIMTPWWSRIIPHRSYVKGWKISPSHYLNQDLANVWLDK